MTRMTITIDCYWALKGTMSEAELHIIKSRLDQGRLNKAKRGELSVSAPIGYFRAENGKIVKDPDEQIRHVVDLIFQKFDEYGSASAVLRYLVKHQIKIGVRSRRREIAMKFTGKDPACRP